MRNLKNSLILFLGVTAILCFALLATPVATQGQSRVNAKTSNVGTLMVSDEAANSLSQGREGAWIKTVVAKIGVGKASKVFIQLRNREEVEGYIFQALGDDFIVRDSTGKKKLIAYSDVMVTLHSDVRSSSSASTLGTVAVIGVVPRRISASQRLPQWRCNRLWEQYNGAYDAWEAAGGPPQGPQKDAMDFYFDAWFDGCI